VSNLCTQVKIHCLFLVVTNYNASGMSLGYDTTKPLRRSSLSLLPVGVARAHHTKDRGLRNTH
jgi:hypothetical protein